MEFTHLSVLAFFFLALVGINGSKSGEEYWKSVWPNTPMPKSLSDLLLPESDTSVPIKGHEEKQYWTVFFEHDLYPGKKISLGIQKHSDIQPSQVPVKKPSQSFDTRKWLGKSTEKANQPFGFLIWEDKTTEKENQPFGFFSWTEKSTEADTKNENQPFETRKWNDRASQPFGFFSWTEKTTENEAEIEKTNEPFETGTWNDKANQPFGFFSWTEKATETETKKLSQPFRTRKWNDKAISKETEKSSQHSLAHILDENEAHIFHDYCGRPSAIGEDKHCAPSLKSMMDFAISKLGKNIKVMSSSFSQNHDQYVVEEVKKIGDNAVMCHRLNFKKVVFYCHQVNATTTYMVPLVASDGTKSKALTICHHDTRGMDPNVLYDVLNVKPGTVPVCHFIGNKAIAWVPNDVESESEDHPCVI